MAEHPLDDLDRAILRQLEEDGRRSLRDIARSVGSPEATVRARVKRLQDEKILRIVAFADPARLGGAHLALILLKVDLAHHDEVVSSLAELPEVTYVSTLLGRCDLCVEVSVRDDSELWAFLHERVGAIDGVRDVETLSIVKVHKLRYTSPAVG
jgi:Lrp/AsnC family transcriptional regulator for asnA, asnC and gidA